MKKLLLSLALSVAMAVGAFAQNTQTLSLLDSVSGANSGTYAAGSNFSINVFLTLGGGYTTANASGLSYWLQTNSALAPFLTITSNTYFTFTDSTNPTVPKTFNDSSGASPGFLTDKSAFNSGDLGATSIDPTENQPNGTFQVTRLTFTLSNSAPAGAFTIATTTLVPKTSEVNDVNFATFAIPQSNYTLNVSSAAVPEPSTWACLVGGAALLGANFIRRSRKA